MRRIAFVALLVGAVSLSLGADGDADAPTADPAQSTTSRSACTQWNVAGSWVTAQSNGYHPTFEFVQSGTSITGTATLPGGEASRATYSSPVGVVSGSLVADQLIVRVTWPPKADGSVDSGTYSATITAAGLAAGKAGPDSWSGSGSATCVGEEAGIVAFEGKVEFQSGGGAWERLEGPIKLKNGDQIHTGFKAKVKLELPDGSIIDVGPMTLVRFDDITQGKTRVYLPLGAVSATVTRLRGTHGDFEVKTPTTTTSIRGTIFTMFVDPVALVTVVTVKKGTVEVAPSSGPSATVKAGEEVESTAAAVSAPAKPGTAGMPAGGISRSKATKLVLKKLAKAEKPCGLAPRDTLVGLTSIAKGWDLAVTTTLGTSHWTVVKKKLKAVDEAATDLKRRCR